MLIQPPPYQWWELGSSGRSNGSLFPHVSPFPHIDLCTPVFPVYRAGLDLFRVLGSFPIMERYSGISYHSYGQIAFWAHIGGFAAGMLLFSFFVQKKKDEYYY